MTHRTLTICALRQWLCLAALLAGGCGVIADGHNRQGVRSFYQGNYQGGMQSFRKALARDPRNADAYYNMASTLHRLGLQNQSPQYLQQAEELYNQSLDANENHVEAHRGLAVLLAETQRSEKAFRLLRNWAQSNPVSADAHTELARLYEEFNRPDAALQELHEALRHNHQDDRALMALARLREKQGDRRQALENYQRAYAVAPRPEIAARIATLNQQLGMAPGFTLGAPANGGTRMVTGGRAPRY